MKQGEIRQKFKTDKEIEAFEIGYEKATTYFEDEMQQWINKNIKDDLLKEKISWALIKQKIENYETLSKGLEYENNGD